MVDGLRRAFGFLTIYPLRASDAWTPETLGSSMVYYPLVGTFTARPMGLAVLLNMLFPPSVRCALLLAGSLLVTGGLHLDGCRPDRWLSGSYNERRRLAHLQRPAVGPMAVAWCGRSNAVNMPV